MAGARLRRLLMAGARVRRPADTEESGMRLIDVGLREGHEYRVRDTWLTVPNVITLVRLALVPVFVTKQSPTTLSQSL